MEIITACLHSDRRKKPEQKQYRYLTFQELKDNQSTRLLAIDRNGRVVNIKITSTKTWKRKPGKLDVHWKYGLYEYGCTTVYNDAPHNFFVTEVTQ